MVPEATGPRDVKEGVAYIRCPVLESPPPPALLPLSQQPGHCPRPPPQPSAAVVAESRSSVQKAPWPSCLWALVLHTKQLQKPLQGPRTPRCYLPAEAARWGPTCHAPLVQGSALPTAGHSGPFGAPGLFVPRALPWGARGRPRPLGSAVLRAQATPADPLLGALALLLLTLEVVTLTAVCCSHLPTWVTKLFKSSETYLR